MADDESKSRDRSLPRREFLQLAGAGVAALTLRPRLLSSDSPLTARSAPRRPVRLRSAQLEVVLDRNHGLPFSYKLLSRGTTFFGEPFGAPLAARIARLSDGQRVRVEALNPRVQTAATHAQFVFTLRDAAHTAVTCTLRYALEGATLRITLEDVREERGYELLDVAMPALISVREADAGAWLAHGEEGGSHVLLADATAATLPPNTFWGKTLATFPFLMLGTADAACIQEITAFMDGGEMSVSGAAPQRIGTMGGIRVHRVDGAACYDMNTGPNTPRNCGTP